MNLKKTNRKKLCLAFDGFSASGKSLGAKLISKKYKLKLLNSGLLYRYAAYLIIKNMMNGLMFNEYCQLKFFHYLLI